MNPADECTWNGLTIDSISVASSVKPSVTPAAGIERYAPMGARYVHNAPCPAKKINRAMASMPSAPAAQNVEVDGRVGSATTDSVVIMACI
jgi:hypothetical protein